MSSTLVDHAFAVFLVIALPAWGAWQIPRFVREVAAGAPGARTKEYARTIAMEWTATLLLLWYWSTQERSAPALGLVLPDAGGPLILTLTASSGVVGLFVYQWMQVRSSRAARDAVRRQFVNQPTVLAVLPHTTAEARVFTVAALTAGICEEILYRGFLLWYFTAFMPWPAAILVATIVFGLAHAYQGGAGIVRTGIAGAVAMVLYVLTGSLLAPIVMHATVDVASGWMAHRTLAMQSEDEAAAVSITP